MKKKLLLVAQNQMVETKKSTSLSFSFFLELDLLCIRINLNQSMAIILAHFIILRLNKVLIKREYPSFFIYGDW